MPKTVLITGCLGYIGSRLTQYLNAHGLSCIGYDIGFFRDYYERVSTSLTL